MNPVAFMASSGKVITADDAEMMLKHSASYFHIHLFSADQLREAQVKVLREAGRKLILKAVGATNIPMLTGSVRDYLDRMADELEKQA